VLRHFFHGAAAASVASIGSLTRRSDVDRSLGVWRLRFFQRMASAMRRTELNRNLLVRTATTGFHLDHGLDVADAMWKDFSGSLPGSFSICSSAP
jgi:hypothetical protein